MLGEGVEELGSLEVVEDGPPNSDSSSIDGGCEQKFKIHILDKNVG